MKNSVYWIVLKALLAQVLNQVAPAAGEAVEAYKARLKAFISTTGTVAVTRWRIFGIPIHIRLGVGADVRDFLTQEVDMVSAATVTDLIRKLTTAYA